MEKEFGWKDILSGAVIFVIGLGLYAQFSLLERGKVKKVTMPRVVIALYDIGGKWGASGPVTAAGGLLVVAGVAGTISRWRK